MICDRETAITKLEDVAEILNNGWNYDDYLGPGRFYNYIVLCKNVFFLEKGRGFIGEGFIGDVVRFKPTINLTEIVRLITLDELEIALRGFIIK